MLRKASVLPLAFLGGGRRGARCTSGLSGGLDGVSGGVRSVGGDVGGSGGVSRGAGGGARLAHRDLSARPGTSRFASSPRPGICRALLLEAREHVLGAVGGPECQPSVVLTFQPRLRLLVDVLGEG
jgi:hypothetical protein